MRPAAVSHKKETRPGRSLLRAGPSRLLYAGGKKQQTQTHLTFWLDDQAASTTPLWGTARVVVATRMAAAIAVAARVLRANWARVQIAGRPIALSR